MLEEHKQKIGWGMGFGGLLGILYSVAPETVTTYLSETSASKVTQFGFFFMLAAWLHAGRVKKEIKENFQIFTQATEDHAKAVTRAIDNVAVALRQDLSAQGDRIGNVELGIGKLNSRVEVLELNHKGDVK